MTFASAGTAAADRGNADTAKQCHKGGWEELMGQDGTIFAGEEACVAFGAQGGVIMPLNRPPAAVDDTATTGQNIAVLIDVLANDVDPDGDTLTVTVGNPAHGTATVVDGGVRYVPAVNYSGADSFTYTITDRFGGSDTATVNLTVEACPVQIITLSPSLIHNDISIQIIVIISGFDFEALTMTRLAFIQDDHVVEVQPDTMTSPSRVPITIARQQLTGGAWDIYIEVSDGQSTTAAVLPGGLTVVAH